MPANYATRAQAAARAAAANVRKSGLVASRLAKREDSRSFEASRLLAKEYDPEAHLDYIPMGSRWELVWIDDKTLHDPRRGDLMWVGEWARPATAAAMQRVKLFVCRQCVAGDVYTVVTESKKRWAHRQGVQWTAEGRWYIDHEVVEDWMKQAREEWKTMVPAMYDGALKDVDMNEVWRLVTEKAMSKEQFLDWLDQRASENAAEQLSADMAELAMEPEAEEGEIYEIIDLTTGRYASPASETSWTGVTEGSGDEADDESDTDSQLADYEQYEEALWEEFQEEIARELAVETPE
jgi:hypothetical protein